MSKLFPALLAAGGIHASEASAQTAPKPSDLVGSWLYRSFHDRTEPLSEDSSAALKLIFVEGDFEIVSAAKDKVMDSE